MPKGFKIGVFLLCLLLPGRPTPARAVTLPSSAWSASTLAPRELLPEIQEVMEDPAPDFRPQAGEGLDEPIQPHPEGDAAIHQLRSPFCPGLMLEVCPTPRAKLLRDSLQMMAWEGASADSIVDWMLASYGEEYRGVPQTSGSGLFAWLIPPFALFGGLIGVAVALRHFRRGREETPVASPALSEEDESVLAAALEELKASEEVPF